MIKGFQTLAGLPLETQAPYEIYDNGNYYSLKQKLASDTSSIDYAWVNADTTYPLWVDGHQATSASANNIMDTEDVDGNPIATYASNTLTLTNAIIAGSIVSNIPSLTISLLGNSEVSSGILTSDATTNLTIAKNAGAAGQVSLLVQSSSTAPAIKSFNSLTYTGFTPFDDDGTTDLTSSISYSSEARALQSNGNDLTGVKFVSKISLEEAGLSFAMDSKVYTGSAVVLPGTVTMTKGTTETTLTEGTHYTVTGYKDANGTALTGGAPTDHGDYIATILGKGDYMGTVDVPFTITPKAISDASVSVTVNGTYTYTGSAVEPPTGSIVVKDGTTPLVDGTDYTISYNNNVAAGTAAEVIITGKGNYSNTSTKTQTFTIGAKAISDASISVTVNGTYTYTGSAVEPPTGSIVVKDGTTPLVDGTDYTISYNNNVAAGTAAEVIITGKGNYSNTSTKTQTFTIARADISTAVIAAIDAQVYTGSAITPTPAVTWGGKTLTADTDFTYSYTNNTDAAQSTDTPAPTVTITGNGNYTGSATTKFTILDRVASINLGGRTFRTYYNASETNRVPDDVQAYILTGVNGNEVTVQPVSYIPKQTPVLLEAKAGAKSVKNKADDFTTNKLAYATNDVAANGNQYLLYNGEFVRASGTISGKVYLDLGSNSPARSYTINTNNTTAIESVFDEEADGEEKWYDMQGRQINKPTKAGLYIRNGQKVVIKNK